MEKHSTDQYCQKPHTEWCTCKIFLQCRPFRHVDHSFKTGNLFIASKGMDRLTNGQKDFSN